MSIPKYHHIIPSFYLAGFSETGSRLGQIHVFNLMRARRFRKRPETVGGIKHFYRINPDAADPVFFEKWMAKYIENPASIALSEVRAKRKMLSPEHFNHLLCLAAMIHIRSQFGRSVSTKLMREKILKLLLNGEVTQEQWKTYVSDRHWISGGTEKVPDDVHEAIKLVKEGAFSPNELPTGIIAQIPEATNLLLEMLRKRGWSLLVAQEGEGHFITSNSPLTSGEGWFPFQYHEGLGNPKAIVVFPLDCKLALISWDRDPWYHYSAEKKLIALINARTLMRSWGEIYWDGSDFPLMDAGYIVSSFERYYNDFMHHQELHPLGLGVFAPTVSKEIS